MSIIKQKMVFGALALTLAGCGTPEREEGPWAVSPDGRNEIRLATNPLAYEVLRDGVVVVAKTPIGLVVDGRELGAGATLKARTHLKIGGSVATPIYKKSSVDLTRNETYFDFGTWGVRLAARDDGVAYRFETKLPGRVRITGERAGVTVPSATAKCWVNFTDQIGCEETVNKTLKAAVAAEEAGKPNTCAYLPFCYTVGKQSVAVTESDVRDYPIWNLKKGMASAAGTVHFGSIFAPWPAKEVHTYETENWSKRVEQATGGRWVAVKENADYLVETEGTRTYPWRTFVLAEVAVQFCESDIVYALARAKDPTADFSWVRPGKVAWDWWNAWGNLGEELGCTTKNYKRYIDFASANGIEYVILDEGWSARLNIWKGNPKVDVAELIRYGAEKGVGIILWMAWAQVYGDEERVAEHFSKMGAKGFKIDFMDRGDAKAERFLWKFADCCARRRMVLDYHGAHRPTGMQRAYPNVLNFEGVHGLECMKFYRQEDFLANDLKSFYCRLTAGPMDYTPGAMQNYKYGEYKGTGREPGSIGTRTHQIAMMVMYEAPLQMLCDSPEHYEDNAECLKFMASVPVTWDETRGLAGTPDSFALVARRKGKAWYIAAMGDKSQSRYVVIPTEFLGKGSLWQAEIFRDSSSANEYPTQYAHETKTITAGKPLTVKMARGGGYVMRLTRK